MGIFQRLFGGASAKAAAPSQAVLVHLDGQGLPDEVYEEYDLATIEDQLRAVIDAGGLGEFDGNDVGEEGATLYMYGPDAERLFVAIEATLRAYPLCKNARVVIRAGEPGAPEREVRL